MFSCMSVWVHFCERCTIGRASPEVITTQLLDPLIPLPPQIQFDRSKLDVYISSKRELSIGNSHPTRVLVSSCPVSIWVRNVRSTDTTPENASPCPGGVSNKRLISTQRWHLCWRRKFSKNPETSSMSCLKNVFTLFSMNTSSRIVYESILANVTFPELLQLAPQYILTGSFCLIRNALTPWEISAHQVSTLLPLSTISCVLKNSL